MGRFVGQRLATLIPLWLVCALAVFLLMRLAPGDPAQILAGSGASGEEVRRLRSDLGLDRPLAVQILGWYGRVLQGDLGVSYQSRAPVLATLLERLGPTLQLALTATFVATLLGIVVGTLAALRPRGWGDTALMALTTTGLALPSFLVAILFIFVFAVWIDWLPVRGYVEPTEDLARWARHMILPALTYGVIQGAVVARMARGGMLDVLGQDYVVTARSKGLSEWSVVAKHALKNAVLPVVTVVGLNVGVLLASAVVVETIFGIPGVGSELVRAIFQRDYPLVQGIVLLVVTLFLFLNLLVDIAYAALDPRIGHG
ncbi:MAG: ABC transporter permease [Candidatus Rokubacteria bacterium]|nr:ABC transporter permease [Candidatus Rokubacteria bacterium]